jgi:hypothetical protein
MNDDTNQISNNNHPAERYRGQATTEYALILLVAAVIGLAVIAWATTGGGAGKIGGLFDSMIDLIIERASSTF